MRFFARCVIIGTCVVIATMGSAGRGLGAGSAKPWMVPFGIELGQPLPKDIRHEGKDAWPGGDLGAFTVKYSWAVPPVPARMNPAPSKAVEYPFGYNVYATPTSGTVYRVSADLPYRDVAACKKAAADFVQRVGTEATVFEGGNWRNGRIDILKDISVVAVVIGGKKTGAFDAGRPMILRDVEALAGAEGVRFVLACGGNRMKLSAIHLPSLELRIAEGFQANERLMELYASGEKEASPQMSPFGLRLGKPLPEGARIRLQEDEFGGIDAPLVYDIRPPQPHDLFWRYEARVTPMTESLVALTAYRAVKTMNECMESLNNVAKPLAEAFRQPKPKWYRQTGFNFIHTHLKPDSSVSKLLPLNVNIYCEPASMNGKPDWSHDLGAKARGLNWRGFVQFELFEQNLMTELEHGLMNPEGDG